MKAYHFLLQNMNAGSGGEKAWKAGETRTKREAKLCERGYHSSPSWYDALQYAPGPMACIVDVSEPIERDRTKQVSLTRTLVDCRDATRVLHLFACECAERALKVAGATDERSWNAVAVKRLWLDGKATNEEMAAAWDAAWDAAQDATWDAARDAAWDAAWDAARDAAWAAARAAARDAAWAAARAAAWDAARAATWDAARDAAWDAAWDAARAAAWDAEVAWQRERLDEMMNELFEVQR
jgi:hypothetical protein